MWITFGCLLKRFFSCHISRCFFLQKRWKKKPCKTSVVRPVVPLYILNLYSCQLHGWHYKYQQIYKSYQQQIKLISCHSMLLHCWILHRHQSRPNTITHVIETCISLYVKSRAIVFNLHNVYVIIIITNSLLNIPFYGSFLRVFNMFFWFHSTLAISWFLSTENHKSHGNSTKASWPYFLPSLCFMISLFAFALEFSLVLLLYCYYPDHI